MQLASVPKLLTCSVAETLVVPFCVIVHYVFGYRCGSSPNFPVKSPYGSPGSVKLLVPPTCFWGGTRFEVPRFS